MASSSSSSRIKRYQVFSSFHGPDVRKRFLSHLHTHFASKGITTFNDQEMERGHTIGPKLVQAIRESRIWIVVLSKQYASSSWCLGELVEILKCKEENEGQIVIPIFYEVDPSDVRKQSGDFGKAFEKTCEGKPDGEKMIWSKALAHVANIAGEHSINSDNEAEMIKKIARDVSNKLNLTTPSRDFEGMVGMEAHLTKLNSLLCLGRDDVKMIGIWGPAGIGKTTIARALYEQLSTDFQLKCFMENLKGSVDGYESKKSLQQHLLSMVLNQNNLKIHNLEAIRDRLHDQRVLIILDDVDYLEKLEVLADELSWFGHGSRIIVTTEDKKILEAHRIYDIYHVDFPSEEEALEILCLSAFKQSSVQDGFEELAKKVAKLCGNLPLGLCVVGSSLRGDSKHRWERQLSRIEATLHREIEDILKVGYDRLSTKEDQSLFLHIACFFNNEDDGRVTSMLSDSNLDVGNGLNILADRSLMHISTDGRIVMHHLLQKLGRQIVREESDDPGKRQFLNEANEIRDVLTNETGTGTVIGISFDTSTSKIGKVSVSKGAFVGMRNLRFLRIYGSLDYFSHFIRNQRIINKDKFSGGEDDLSDDKGDLQIPEDMDYLPPLRLLRWDHYPRKSLPAKFKPESLVEIRMQCSNLEKLWDGIQPLPHLKIINLTRSRRLKEIPNLSNATNLEELTLEACSSLGELPSSIQNLHKLKKLNVKYCSMLQVIPTNINLASLERLDMIGCSRLRIFPDISKNIEILNLGDTNIEDVPPSFAEYFSRLGHLNMCSSSVKRLTHVPLCITTLYLQGSSIKKIPDCIIGLKSLTILSVESCRKLKSIKGLPTSLYYLRADDCVSLERVCLSFHNPTKKLRFINCLKLDEESRRRIIQNSIYEFVWLPGKKIPTEFTHKAIGRSITIPLDQGTLSASSRFKACLLILPVVSSTDPIRCSIRSKGGVTVESNEPEWNTCVNLQSEHLFIFHGDLLFQRNRFHEVDVPMSVITFKFRFEGGNNDKIVECGVQIMKDEAEGSSSRELESFETESSSYDIESSSSSEEVDNNTHNTDGDGDYNEEGSKFSRDENINTRKHTGFRSWLTKLGLKKKKMNMTEQNSRRIS